MKDDKLDVWKFRAKTPKVITFIVTQDCQLSCRYCYLVKKNDKGKMSIETARKAVDYILDNPTYFNERGVFFEFIG